MDVAVELCQCAVGGLEEGKLKPSGGAREGFTKIYKVTLDLHFKEKVSKFGWEVRRLFQAKGAAEAKKQRHRTAY